MLSEVRLDQPDLSLRQLAVLLVVYQVDELQTVRGLAAQLNVARSIISRALDRLGDFELVARQIDPGDSRSIIVR
ncbi:MarR family transcriptional regulator [Belnapia sp. T6]|uniref:MarR family transcriptional regulator n=1 Tax=Belnapia mucosa TaxID=2804532 RepID=A0ABS1VCY0_9PROT|nr:MarR family transcriptional regulator [Belnapia mucosa]MBL6459528.1 MarR family transcriptional regulator [Belnapia mucosa]